MRLILFLGLTPGDGNFVKPIKLIQKLILIPVKCIPGGQVVPVHLSRMLLEEMQAII